MYRLLWDAGKTVLYRQIKKLCSPFKCCIIKIKKAV